MTFTRVALIAATYLAASVSCLSAANVTWNLQGVVFGVGTFAVGSGGVTGSFAYDADTHTYSSVNLTSNLGSSTGILPYSDSLHLDTVNGTGDMLNDFSIWLTFASAPTNAGGTIAVSFVAAGNCEFSDCHAILDSGASNNSGAYAGSIVSGSAGAPEPSAVLLGSGGLLACWNIKRRQRRG